MTFWLAHQGGWDELLTFLLPIALVVGTWFLLERRRASRGRSEEDPMTSTGVDEAATGPTDQRDEA